MHGEPEGEFKVAEEDLKVSSHTSQPGVTS